MQACPRVFATNVEYSEQARGKICSYCAKNHCTNVCEDILALNRDDALKFLSENKLCFGCADSTEHIARNCNLRSICAKCDKRHLTALHIERPTITGNSKCTEVCGYSTSVVDNSMILPIWIRSKQTPNKEVLCYCIIDEQSNACFMSEELREQLGLSGIDTNLTLSTVLKAMSSFLVKELLTLKF